jgi:subtilisin family serine protease
MTEGAADTTLGTTYISDAVTIVQSGINTAIDNATDSAADATAVKNLLNDETAYLNLLGTVSLTADERNDLTVLGRLYRNIKTSSNLYSHLDVTGVQQVHADGWTGKGITIAVYDTEFDSLSGHGFNVSLLVASVAPAATINEYTGLNVPIEILNSDVITTSINGATTSRATAVEGSNALVTVAAQHTNGPLEDKARMSSCDVNNRTVANCNTWAEVGLNGANVIYVGEVDGNDTIPASSNKAGDTHKNQFLVTTSNALYNPIGDTNGNSYAAPRVAGAGALVRHKFPNLTGSQTATTILHTADDLGASGVDSVYGHGKLNVGKALAPVGNLH